MTRRPPFIAGLALAALLIAGCARGGAPDVSTSGLPDSVTRPLSHQSTEPFDPDRDPVVQVVERVRPAVVNVTTDALRDTGGGLQPDQGVGSGFIVRADGIVVTNCHVVEGANQITVITSAEEPERFDARVIGHDCEHDLAVLKVDAEGLPTVSLGNSSELLLGQRVVALGYALALEGGPSVTSGIVSALDRVIEVDDPNFGVRVYESTIQTDAAINPGNSGGPLVDLAGNVVGINSAGASAGSAENIGFSIAIDSAKPTIDRAIADPEAPVAYLGVVTQPVEPALSLQLDLPVEEGAYVVAVSPGGPAEQAGIAAGDVIVEFDGTSVAGSTDLGELIRQHRPEDEVGVVAISPSGDPKQVSVTLGLNPGPTLP
jgi:serine protease Do